MPPPTTRSASSATAPALHVLLLLLLTLSTGVLDAATYIGLDGVFTANMTGNVIFLGIGLVDRDGVVLLRSALALGGFLAGAAVLGRVARGRPARGGADPLVGWTLLVAALVVGGTALLVALVSITPGLLDAVTVTTAAAMGAQAIAARRVGVPDVTTVVVTSTLAGLAAEHRWGSRTAGARSALRRGGAVASMLLGALVGAVLLRWHLWAAIGLTAAVLAVVGVSVLVAARRARRAAPAAA
ncbi:YoaK family protein [Quadrisphaera sp. KR29]|uniref:YoaK family protein n=1 Tax=Quadrisphaera sp. KR29 TaxID=3461391 RepID=UPI0040443718